ncbi:DUF3800 domain-containing protein [Candidatus Poriferisodalis sp.]|uniref:DUF3800 domain-containing protein n=1 Tax=Candidatus Poriferisodalis sp. TaxID=3101277 RepID=UPI003B0214A1
MCPPFPDTNPNNPVPGGLLGTTYLVYVDDSGDESQDLLTALAIPATVWADTLQAWKKFRSWVARQFGIHADTELHALDLGTNSNAGRGQLPSLEPGDRSKITRAALSTIRSIAELRILTEFAPVPEGSGGLYPRLVAFVEEFCKFHDSHAIIWYDGTAESLARSTRATHRSLPYSRRVLEDPMGYDSSESHLIQMSDFIAHSAHHAVLNDRGIGSADSYLRKHAYLKLLPTVDTPGHVWPGGIDAVGFPCFAQRLGIRGYPQKHDEPPMKGALVSHSRGSDHLGEHFVLR